MKIRYWNGSALSGLDADTVDGKNYFCQDGTPTASSSGDLWFAPTAGILKIWNGSEWKSAGSSNVVYNDTTNTIDFIFE